MSRPLLITDCDEVLLHMVAPFAEWLDEERAIHFDFECGDFTRALKHHEGGKTVAAEDIWPLLRQFFETEMHRQLPIAGALEALEEIADHADIAILTNVQEQEREGRIAQLARLGVSHPVTCNQGGKGEPLKRLVAEYGASTVVFVDDLGFQHESVAEHAPHVWRLQLVGEPRLAPHIKTNRCAHDRIDDWPNAKRWIIERLTGGLANAA